jgi:hypothetical protein
MAKLNVRCLKFLTLSKKIHLGNYDYSKVEYKNNTSNIIIICKIHGEFTTTPYKHIYSRTGCCKQCINQQVAKLEDFIIKSNVIHKNTYNYSKFLYTKSYKKGIIICPIHGEFNQTPSVHLAGSACFKCSQMHTLKDFEQKAKIKHNNLYTYENFFYSGTYKKSFITCKIHGDYLQCANDHLNGVGCPTCNLSKGELKIYNYLKKYNYKFIREKKFIDLGNLRFDFYLPEHNICIEYDGKQHFKESSKFGGNLGLLKVQKNDTLKNEYCYNNNIQILRIKYKDYKIVDKILNEALNKELSWL